MKITEDQFPTSWRSVIAYGSAMVMGSNGAASLIARCSIATGLVVGLARVASNDGTSAISTKASGVANRKATIRIPLHLRMRDPTLDDA